LSQDIVRSITPAVPAQAAGRLDATAGDARDDLPAP
jgi:hypothetical protein